MNEWSMASLPIKEPVLTRENRIICSVMPHLNTVAGYSHIGLFPWSPCFYISRAWGQCHWPCLDHKDFFLIPTSRLRNKQNSLGCFTYRKSSKNCVDGTNSNGCINRLAESSRLENAGWVVKYLQNDNSLALIKKPSIDGFKARDILSCLSLGASM